MLAKLNIFLCGWSGILKDPALSYTTHFFPCMNCDMALALVPKIWYLHETGLGHVLPMLVLM